MVAIALLGLVAVDAEARLGGGENYGGGGGGGGGFGDGGGGGLSFGGGSSGGGDGIDLVLLIRLIIAWPEVGIPVAIVLMILASMKVRSESKGFQVHGTTPRREERKRRPVGLAAVAERDAAFSRPAFLAFVSLVLRRSLEFVPKDQADILAPYLAPAAAEALRKHLTDGVPDRVVIGATEVLKVVERQGRFRVDIRFVASMELGHRPWLVRTTLRFERDAAALSADPEVVSRLGCPSCGSAADCDRQGRCRACGQPVNDGKRTWLCTEIVGWDREVAPGPDLRAHHGGVEPSVHAPTVRSPDLDRDLRALAGRHGGFDKRAFEARARELFMMLQQAWSDDRMDDVRAWVIDDLWQQFRFYADPYRRDGLRNVLENIELTKLEITDASTDAWYESVSLRLTASMIDTVRDRAGNVVAGDAKTPRRFSEVWTFLRSPDAKGGTDLHHCPSCAAPLDKVNAAGVCGHCESRIATGRFDWVLARIEQANAVAEAQT